ncbi:MAG: hypothetical protein ACKN9T_08670 [Candidatus Methylumidiphilus sp.]
MPAVGAAALWASGRLRKFWTLSFAELKTPNALCRVSADNIPAHVGKRMKAFSGKMPEPRGGCYDIVSDQ